MEHRLRGRDIHEWAAYAEQLERALVPLVNPFGFGEPKWDEMTEGRVDIEIDCCVTITYADVLAARDALLDGSEGGEA